MCSSSAPTHSEALSFEHLALDAQRPGGLPERSRCESGSNRQVKSSTPSAGKGANSAQDLKRQPPQGGDRRKGLAWRAPERIDMGGIEKVSRLRGAAGDMAALFQGPKWLNRAKLIGQSRAGLPIAGGAGKGNHGADIAKALSRRSMSSATGFTADRGA